MKKIKKECVMRFRLSESDGTLKAVPYCNRNIPYPLLDKFNYAIQEVLQKINNKANWKQYYIHFEHNGKKYRQVDTDTKFICKGCAFLKPMNDGTDRMGCGHPHYSTKGNCVGRIYIEED